MNAPGPSPPPWDDVRVDVAVGDPDDRDPEPVTHRELDLGRLAGRVVQPLRRAPVAGRHPRHEHVRRPAVAAQVGDRPVPVAGDVDVADRDHVGVRAVDRGRGEPVRPRGGGEQQQDEQGGEQAWQDDSRSRGSAGSNRRRPRKLRRGQDAFLARLVPPRVDLARAARVVPPQLGPEHARHAGDRGRRRAGGRRSARGGCGAAARPRSVRACSRRAA